MNAVQQATLTRTKLNGAQAFLRTMFRHSSRLWLTEA